MTRRCKRGVNLCFIIDHLWQKHTAQAFEIEFFRLNRVKSLIFF
ncbi:hypothetical protein LDG_6548 [Legionella drancourtii LLAP12]|uniref:Uncharacterized protein n=1 Tax=Legionella drancourtii LLAP12 TaxID=658187 RepID=G9EMS8_9GAMM|nr:hypothetical protein LDG_6548 [Legionella drancourtii LLAP12]